MSIFVPGLPTDAITVTLLGETVPAEQRLSGSPITAALELGEFGDAEIGVWEMTVGSMSDVESDEVFVVVSGHGTLELEPGGPDAELIELAPGTIVRLAAGTNSIWTITETLRKVYIS